MKQAMTTAEIDNLQSRVANRLAAGITDLLSVYVDARKVFYGKEVRAVMIETVQEHQRAIGVEVYSRAAVKNYYLL